MMMRTLALVVVLVLAAVDASRFAIRVAPGVDVHALAREHDMTVVKAVPGLDDVFVFDARQRGEASRARFAASAVARLRRRRDVLFAEEQVPRVRQRRLIKARAVPLPSDPLFASQWHHAVIKTPAAWQITRGKGAIVSIVDDGCQFQHPELSVQYVARLSRNLNSGDNQDPSPNVANEDFHGTACAGVATGHNNSVCGVGSAYEASLAAVRLIGEAVDDATEAEGVTVGMDEVSVYSCSWGPTDDGHRLEAPGTVMRMAIERAAVAGRGGRGSIWMWAAGNGARAQDECNFDGYANHPLTIAVGAVTDQGVKSSYSEECSALMVMAPSSGGVHGITTCDIMGPRGYSPTDCTDTFGGTSSAAPLAAGVVALMLSANPRLGWKDVQYILMTTAERIDVSDPSWKRNGANRWFSHKYGYGRIDAHAAVVAARDYATPLAVALGRTSGPFARVNAPIPQLTPVESTVQLTLNGTVEHLQIIVNMDHPRVTELSVRLTAPSGMTSVLAKLRGFALSMSLGTSATSYSATVAAFSSHTAFSADLPVLMVKGLDGATCTAQDFNAANAGVSVKGKIAMVMRGGCTFIDKAATLAELGAAVVLVVQHAGEQLFQMSGSGDLSIPVAMVTRETADALATITTTVQARLSITKADIPLEYRMWAFASVAHWGESPSGTWRLTVVDEYGEAGAASQGSLLSWQLVVWGNDPSVDSNPIASGSDTWTDVIIIGVVVVALLLVVLAVLAFRKLLSGVRSPPTKTVDAATPPVVEDGALQLDVVTEDGEASRVDDDFQ